MITDASRRRARRRQLLVAPIGAALVTAVPGVVGLLLHRLLLFPSLGPTALMQAHAPEHSSSRPYHVVVGHMGGLASAFLAVWLLGIAHAPSVYALHALTIRRVAAAALAILLATLLELLLHAAHPPAASTTLLAALGSFTPTLRDALDVAVGVVLVALAGEVLRRVSLAGQEGTTAGAAPGGAPAAGAWRSPPARS